MNLPSKLMEQAVEEFAKFPGIGKKTALRLVLHLLKQDANDVQQFLARIHNLKSGIHFCSHCFNIADASLCSICANPLRDHATVCVVENIRDLIAIENTSQYRGEYHVLGGVISPIEGIGPGQLHITPLLEKLNSGSVAEVIMALNPTIEGDTTVFYITKKITNPAIRITTIARGIAFGNELEYADEVTLARSLAARLPYEKMMQQKEE
jgi:recombination protein RecR